MITLSNNTKGLALLQQVEEIYGKVYTSDSLLETVLYWGINCTLFNLNDKELFKHYFLFISATAIRCLPTRVRIYSIDHQLKVYMIRETRMNTFIISKSAQRSDTDRAIAMECHETTLAISYIGHVGHLHLHSSATEYIKTYILCIFTSEGFVVSTFRQTLRLTTLKIYY